MIKIDIQPLEGVNINGLGKIALAQPKKEIVALLGTPSPTSGGRQLFYDEYELRIDLDKKDNVEFIEFINGPFPEKTVVTIYDINPFRMIAGQLVTLLKEKNNGAVNDEEATYCYTFPGISVGIWREVTEQEVAAAIAGMKEDGAYEANRDWLEDDLEKARYFWTIGIGVQNYYK